MSDQLKLSKLFYVNPRLLPIPITPPRLPIATTRARLTLLKNDIFTNGFDPNLPIIVRTTLHPTTLYKPKHPRFPSVTSILDIVWHTKYTGEAVNQIEDGNHRLAIALELKLDYVPVRFQFREF